MEKERTYPSLTYEASYYSPTKTKNITKKPQRPKSILNIDTKNPQQNTSKPNPTTTTKKGIYTKRPSETSPRNTRLV